MAMRKRTGMAPDNTGPAPELRTRDQHTDTKKKKKRRNSGSSEGKKRSSADAATRYATDTAIMPSDREPPGGGKEEEERRDKEEEEKEQLHQGEKEEEEEEEEQAEAVASRRVTWEEVGVGAWLGRACRGMGLMAPTLVQAQCIPPTLAGRDVIGSAKTGSGKTAAFALPILQRLSEEPHGVFALVLTPTRYGGTGDPPLHSLSLSLLTYPSAYDARSSRMCVCVCMRLYDQGAGHADR